jgi:hypothetical protein
MSGEMMQATLDIAISNPVSSGRNENTTAAPGTVASNDSKKSKNRRVDANANFMAGGVGGRRISILEQLPADEVDQIQPG